MLLDDQTIRAIRNGVEAGGNIVFITGAGISAESGIRTYRGDDGLWTSDGTAAMSRATLAYFSTLSGTELAMASRPQSRSDHRRAQPGAHRSRSTRSCHWGPDGPHHPERGPTPHPSRQQRRADLRDPRALRGNALHSGCPCVPPIPRELNSWTDESDWIDVRDLLECPECGFATRPHVLWFDEFYDEANYRIKTVGSQAARVLRRVSPLGPRAAYRWLRALPGLPPKPEPS